MIYRFRHLSRNRSFHHPPFTTHHPPSSFPPSCPSAPAVPCPALPCPSPFPALLPCPTPTTTRGGLGFLRELLIGTKSTKMGGSDVISANPFCLKRVLYFKTPTKLKKRVLKSGGIVRVILRLVRLFKTKTLPNIHPCCL